MAGASLIPPSSSSFSFSSSPAVGRASRAASRVQFSPTVVARALTLAPGGDEKGRTVAGVAPRVLAPLYSMGFFHASPKRRKTAWGFVVGIFCIVRAVKALSYPWRSIVDGGVVLGLSAGVACVANCITLLRCIALHQIVSYNITPFLCVGPLGRSHVCRPKNEESDIESELKTENERRVE